MICRVVDTSKERRRPTKTRIEVVRNDIKVINVISKIALNQTKQKHKIR